MSTAKVEEAEYKLDPLKWLVVFALIIGGAFANSYYSSDIDLLYRVIAMLVVGIAAAFVAVNTARGSAFWALLKAAQVEVRKVVWPSRQETTQTTLIVSVVVVITAFILWGLDALIGWGASQIIG